MNKSHLFGGISFCLLWLYIRAWFIAVTVHTCMIHCMTALRVLCLIYLLVELFPVRCVLFPLLKGPYWVKERKFWNGVGPTSLYIEKGWWVEFPLESPWASILKLIWGTRVIFIISIKTFLLHVRKKPPKKERFRDYHKSFNIKGKSTEIQPIL